VTSVRGNNTLRIRVDSGVVAVPGQVTTDAPVVLTNLYAVAYLATTNRGPLALATIDTVRFADRRGWVAVGASDSVRLAGYLRFGERRSVGAEFDFPSDSAPAHAWLVFRLSAKVVDRWLPFDPSGPLRVGRSGGSVHVYACSDRDITGQVDSARANGLRRAYGAVC